jgi:Flp pilus assembly pilin Flp
MRLGGQDHDGRLVRLENLLAAATPERPRASAEVQIRTSEGLERWLRCNHSLLYEGGEWTTDVVIVHDVTRIRQAERADHLARLVEDLLLASWISSEPVGTAVVACSGSAPTWPRRPAGRPAPPGGARPSPSGCLWPVAATPARTAAPTAATGATTPSRQDQGPAPPRPPLPLLVTLSLPGTVVHNPRVDRAGGERGATAVAYAMMVAILALLLVGGIVVLSGSVGGALDEAGQCVANPTSCEIGGGSGGGQNGGGNGGATTTTNGSSTTTSTTSAGP